MLMLLSFPQCFIVTSQKENETYRKEGVKSQLETKSDGFLLPLDLNSVGFVPADTAEIALRIQTQWKPSAPLRQSYFLFFFLNFSSIFSKGKKINKPWSRFWWWHFYEVSSAVSSGSSFLSGVVLEPLMSFLRCSVAPRRSQKLLFTTESIGIKL